LYPVRIYAKIFYLYASMSPIVA